MAACAGPLLSLDVDTGVLRVPGKPPQVLSWQLCEVLLVLMLHAPDPVPVDVLRLAVWGAGADAAVVNIAHQVLRLREALEEDARKPRVLVTVWGRGYTVLTNILIGSGVSPADEVGTAGSRDPAKASAARALTDLFVNRPAVRCGALRVDPAAVSVAFDGKLLPQLPLRPFVLLLELASRPGELVTLGELEECAARYWPAAEPQRCVRVAMKTLRHLLLAAGAGDCLRPVPKTGFVLQSAPAALSRPSPDEHDTDVPT